MKESRGENGTALLHTQAGLTASPTDAFNTLLQIMEEGYSEEYGARPLRRVIQNRVEDALSDGILAGEFGEGDRVLLDGADRVEGDQVGGEEGQITLSLVEQGEEQPDAALVAAVPQASTQRRRGTEGAEARRVRRVRAPNQQAPAMPAPVSRWNP